MALTRITKGVIKPNENYDTHNIVSTGIVTAVGLDVNGNADISGNFSVGGVLTYEDVTSIDSVGIITARSGLVSPYADIDDFLDVGSSIKLGNAGVITATSFVGSGAALTGIDATAIKDSGGNVKVQAQASGAMYTGIHTFSSGAEVGSNIKLGNAGVVTATTFKGDGDFVELDVDGHTNLDNVSIAGVSTFSNNVKFDGATAGRDVTFIRSSNTLEFASNAILELGNGGSGDCRLFNNGTDTRIINGNGTLKFESDTHEFKDKDNTTSYLSIDSSGKVGINESANINAKLHIQHDALDENILYATRYNDQANDKPIFCVTESKMDGFVDSGLVIGTHNRSMRLGAVFASNAGVTTSTAGGITINLSATGASAAVSNVGINTGRPENALVVKHSEPTIRLVNTSIPNASESGRIRFTEYDTDYQGAFIHYNGNVNKLFFGTHATAGNSAANDVNVMTIDRDSGITTFRNNVQFHGNIIRVPTRTSDPGSGVTGDMYYNTTNNNLKIYSGSGWGGLQFAKGTQSNPATSPSDLGATGALAQYYFSPDGGTAFQNYACGALSNLGTIPSGGPSWVANISSLVIIHKAQVGTTASMMMSRANYLKFIEESDTRTNNTNYIYWSVWDNGTLWGITRTRWTGITYSTWANAHGSQGVDNNTLDGTPVWDVWKTGSGTAGGTISTGSYTVSNDNNLVRAVLPGDPHGGSANNRGLHYKRTSSGEHYPWFNGSGNITDNGYFEPSSSYYMGTDSRYQHYLFLSDT